MVDIEIEEESKGSLRRYYCESEYAKSESSESLHDKAKRGRLKSGKGCICRCRDLLDGLFLRPELVEGSKKLNKLISEWESELNLSVLWSEDAYDGQKTMTPVVLNEMNNSDLLVKFETPTEISLIAFPMKKSKSIDDLKLVLN